MAAPPDISAQPFAEGCPKRPWYSKKWTFAVWAVTTLAALFVFYLWWMDTPKDMVLFGILALLGATIMLTLGGIAALDRYRMGLVQVAEVVRGKNVVDETDEVLEVPTYPGNVEEVAETP